jgi:MFS family permease
LSLFAFALGTGSYMGPVAAGYITESQGWRFCFWYLVIFFGIILLLQIFTQEESIFRRPLPEPEALQELNKDGSVKEGDFTGENPKPLITKRNRRDTVTTVSTFPISAQTYWQRMAPIHTKNANPKKWWWLALFPFRLTTFPAILWVGIMTGIQIMWLSLLSVTQSEIFSVPPYNFGIAAGM